MANEHTHHNGRLMVVIAEDDSSLGQALFFLLRVEGYEVRLFKSAAALLEGPLEPADCLIVDDRLADVPGLQVLKLLRQHKVSLPAILLVDDVDSPMRAEALAGGFAIVEKPFNGDQLITAVQAATRRSPGA